MSGTTSDGAPFAGYEMHMGVTEGPDRARPFARLADGSPEGAVSAGRPRRRHLRPRSVRRRPAARRVVARFGDGRNIAYDELVERTLDALAAHLAAHLDLDRLLKLAR